MTRSLQLRTIAIVSLLGLVALGAVTLSGFWHPEAPAEAMRAYLPRITLPLVLQCCFCTAARGYSGGRFHPAHPESASALESTP